MKDNSTGACISVGKVVSQKQMSGRTLGPAFCQVQGDGFEGIFRDGKGGGIFTFSIPDSELIGLKGDIIEGDSADFNGP